MSGTRGYHHARGILVDGTGRCNKRRLFESLSLFKVDPVYVGDPKYTSKEFDILMQIALGDHGHGERFRSAPALILLVGNPCDSAYSTDALLGMLAEPLKKYQDYLEVIFLEGPEDTVASYWGQLAD
jgi:hypothetical protein